MSSVYSARLFTVNNKFLQTFDDFLPSSFGLMVDANNLYGGVMQQYTLPQNSFELDEDITLDSILSTSEDSIFGYILEVDLDYPEELHNSHSDFPLAPNRGAIKLEWFGEYQEELREKLGMRLVSKTKKFLQTLFNNEHYTLHYITLKLYVSLGLKVKKIYRVLKFHQSRWLAPYIELNTKSRMEAKNKFDENFYKLMINSVYCKMCETSRNRIQANLILSEEELLE